MPSPVIHTSNIGVELEPYPLDLASVLSGEPNPRGHVLYRSETDGARLVCGIYACDPGVVRNTLTSNETIHVLEGNVSIEVAGETVDLAPGDVAVLPKGHVATWTFRTPFKEMFVLSS